MIVGRERLPGEFPAEEVPSQEDLLRDLERVLASLLPLARDRLGLALRGTRGRVSWLSARAMSRAVRPS